MGIYAEPWKSRNRGLFKKSKTSSHDQQEGDASSGNTAQSGDNQVGNGPGKAQWKIQGTGKAEKNWGTNSGCQDQTDHYVWAWFRSLSRYNRCKDWPCLSPSWPETSRPTLTLPSFLSAWPPVPVRVASGTESLSSRQPGPQPRAVGTWAELGAVPAVLTNVVNFLFPRFETPYWVGWVDYFALALRRPVGWPTPQSSGQG